MPPMSVWRRITSVCCMFSIVESLKEVCIYTAERVAIQCTHVLGENCVVWLHRRRVRRRLRSEGGGGFRIGGNNCQRQQVVAWEQSACLRTFLRGSNLASVQGHSESDWYGATLGLKLVTSERRVNWQFRKLGVIGGLRIRLPSSYPTVKEWAKAWTENLWQVSRSKCK